MIEILQLIPNGEDCLARLGCACGNPSLALYNCEADQIIFCSNCGEITTRDRLITESAQPLTSARVTWLNVTNRAECPLVNVSIPVLAIFASPGSAGGDKVELPAIVTKISTDKCFLRLEETIHPEQFEQPQQICLRAADLPLAGETFGYLEEVLRPHGPHGPTYYKIRLNLGNPQRKSELESFFQSTCGLQFDWRVLLYADLANANHLRRLVHDCLPMARIEIAGDVTDFTRLFNEHTPDLTLLPLVPELLQLVSQQSGGRHSASHRMVVLIKERTAADTRRALHWGADDILIYNCSIEDMRRAIQRCQKYGIEDASLSLGHSSMSNGAAMPVGGEAIGIVSSSEEDAVNLLCMASETHDANSSNHLARMSAYSAAIARQLGLPPRSVARLAIASKLHDVGKLGVPDEILHKTGALTEDERKIMQLHSQRGYQILHSSASEIMRLGATIALRHHERSDGTGYPAGVAGDAIPIEAQIVSVADVFDALTTARAYKPSWSNEKTIGHLKEQTERMFGPAVVDAFLAVFPEIEKNQLRFLDDFRDIWTERRKDSRYPIAPISIGLEIAMPEHTFRPYPLTGQLCNLSRGGLQILLDNVPFDLFSLLINARRYAKLLCEDPDWQAALHQISCSVVWIDFYSIPAPQSCLMGLSFQKSSPDLELAVDGLDRDRLLGHATSGNGR